ncbi:DMT family transporter [Acinetobacter rudis]|uniref:EamA domain-containing protein n=1 Tax=Acinetobacter rudis CIP 110305 TaxID=421052 RepID=S3MV31_9GAMM|nr:DMT family transporter [Acinetobacter rudis]EPF70418.1 hypothetical protein F945_03444 [Acinetobacter rudis CIP 110305]
MISSRTQGYIFVVITMCIWGGFTITSRLNAVWHISPWDITAFRFGLAFLILFPILLIRKDTAFLWHKEPFILALIGGVAYCLVSYSAFHYAPAAHAAIFLNGFLPLCTAVAAYILFKEPFERDTWISVVIMLSAIVIMSYLMYRSTGTAFGLGDLLFFTSAVLWAVFTVLLRHWKLSAWHSMTSVAIWSAIIYLPIYLLFLPHQYQQVQPMHMLMQTLFHGIFVVMVATMAYVEAIKRLGAFKTGSIVTLAPFIAAVVAVPLLNEPLSPAIMFGLLGMGIGALQPWRWWGRKSALDQALAAQKAQQNKPDQD